MRLIGQLDTESHARIFRAYLLTRDLHSDVELNRNQKWDIWVHEETRLDEAREELEKFIANPRDPVYTAAAETGRKIEQAKDKEQREFSKRQQDLRLRWHMSQGRGGFLTLALMIISVGTTLLMNMPEWGPWIRSAFSIMGLTIVGEMVYFARDPLIEIKNGQVWRLITPIFLHFSIFHILFNMMWIKVLGGAVESVQGSWKLALHVVVYAIAGNVVQFYMSGPLFGGMSGVNYGLFAYVWLVGKEEGDSRYYIDNFNIGLMLFWFFACLVGIIPHVANGAHGAGLVLGALAAVIKLRRVPFTKVSF